MEEQHGRNGIRGNPENPSQQQFLDTMGRIPRTRRQPWLTPQDSPGNDNKEATQQPDWYFEEGFLVYTAAYHLKRGSCCGSGCRHCPYDPKHVEGNRNFRP